VPNLETVIEEWRNRFGYGNNADPASCFDDLKSVLRQFRTQLQQDPGLVEEIDRSLKEIADVVRELEQDDYPEPDGVSSFYDGKAQGKHQHGSRSIFDDVVSSFLNTAVFLAGTRPLLRKHKLRRLKINLNAER